MERIAMATPTEEAAWKKSSSTLIWKGKKDIWHKEKRQKTGTLTYPQTPPIGGTHNPN
jgi:hypothetical protein